MAIAELEKQRQVAADLSRQLETAREDTEAALNRLKTEDTAVCLFVCLVGYVVYSLARVLLLLLLLLG